jgi:hypothetical protein
LPLVSGKSVQANLLPQSIRVISCAATVWLYPREPPRVICNGSLDEDHHLLSGFSASHEGAGNTDKRVSTSVASSSSGPPADLLPTATPTNPEAPYGSRRCSAASAVSEQPSSASSPAYHSAIEDLSEVGMLATPAASSVPLNQTQVEIVGVIDKIWVLCHRGDYACAYRLRLVACRIPFDYWANRAWSFPRSSFQGRS